MNSDTDDMPNGIVLDLIKQHGLSKQCGVHCDFLLAKAATASDLQGDALVGHIRKQVLARALGRPIVATVPGRAGLAGRPRVGGTMHRLA